jgi:hypothetical protein
VLAKPCNMFRAAFLQRMTLAVRVRSRIVGGADAIRASRAGIHVPSAFRVGRPYVGINVGMGSGLCGRPCADKFGVAILV